MLYGAHGIFLVIEEGLVVGDGPGLRLEAIELTPDDPLGLQPGAEVVARAWECRVIDRPLHQVKR